MTCSLAEVRGVRDALIMTQQGHVVGSLGRIAGDGLGAREEADKGSVRMEVLGVGESNASGAYREAV
jgi:hypothetical protein